MVRVLNRKENHCQYLSLSGQTYLDALGKFFTLDLGFYDSYTRFHKSWVLLMQSDILLNSNGYLFVCSKCKGLNGSKASEDCENKKYHNRSNSNSGYGKEDIVHSYTLESALNEVKNMSKNKQAEGVLSCGYIIKDGTGLFSRLNDSSSGIYQNLELFRSIRNEDQHGAIEPNEKLAPIWQRITLPFVIANARNFFLTYKQMYDIHLERQCSKKLSVHCFCRDVLSPDFLKAHIRFPVSYDAFFGNDGFDSPLRYEQELDNERQKLDDLLSSAENKILQHEFNIKRSSKTGQSVPHLSEKILYEKAKIQKLEEDRKPLELDFKAYEEAFGKQGTALRPMLGDMWRRLGTEQGEHIKIEFETKLIDSNAANLVLQGNDYSVLSYYIYPTLSAVVEALADRGLDYTTRKLQVFRDDLEASNTSGIFYASIYGSIRYSQYFVDYITHAVEEDECV